MGEPLRVAFRRSGLLAVGLLLVLVYAPTCAWLVHRWSLGVWYHVHGFAVVPIALWLAFARLREARALPPGASAWGFAFLVPAVLLQVVDAALRFELLSAVSLVLAVPGLCLLLLGPARTRALWFPLLFLLFAVPIPLAVASRVHLVLRQIAARGTAGVLDAIGYGVAREGTLLQVGPESLQVADACSGFSTLMALFMAALLHAHLQRMRAWRTAAVAALVFPLAALANVGRCAFLCMVVVAYGQDTLSTWIHPASGLLTFAVALGALLAADRWALARFGGAA